jgi:hypothetical protein
VNRPVAWTVALWLQRKCLLLTPLDTFVAWTGVATSPGAQQKTVDFRHDCIAGENTTCSQMAVVVAPRIDALLFDL